MPVRNRWRLRDRVLVVLTAALAAACPWLANEVSQRQVMTPNAARALGMLFAGSAMSVPADDQDGDGELSFREFMAAQERQLGAVEAIVVVWRWIMWSVGGLLGVLALLAAITERCRLWLLMAGGVILLSTVASILAMRMLIHPDYGGMPPLSPWSHVIVASVQSLFGFVLLIAYWRKPRPAPARSG